MDKLVVTHLYIHKLDFRQVADACRWTIAHGSNATWMRGGTTRSAKTRNMVQAIANAGAVVMDKVLVHRSPTTSNVTAIGVLPVPLFAVLLGGVRAHVFAHATFKIAVELGARRLRHFVSLRSLPAAARVIDYIRSPLRQHRSESVRGR